MYYDPCAVGERIQLLRKERELTQDQLAIDLNISDRYMRNLERGERVPSIDLFVELREKFGSSLDYIVLGITASEREQIMQKQLQETFKALKEMYTDRLNGLLPEEDFQRIFTRIKLEREQLEGRRKSLELKKKSPVSQEDEAKELVQRFLETSGENRELLVSLIERIELTADKEIIIKFRFPELDEKAKKR